MINVWRSMVEKKYSWMVLFTLFFSTVLKAEHSFSNYRDYPITETTFKIEKVANNLSYPWGMSFIDKEHLLVTEKGGTLLKINVNSGEKMDISHNIQSIRFDGGGASDQGGLLDVYIHDVDDYIYFTYSHDLKASVSQKAKERHSSSAIARGRLENNKIIDQDMSQ